MSGPNYRCGCEDGYDCTKTTMCSIQSAIEEETETIEGLKAAMVDAIAVLDNDLFKSRVKNARTHLTDALDQYGYPDE